MIGTTSLFRAPLAGVATPSPQALQIAAIFEESVRVKERVIETQSETLAAITRLLIRALADGGKILIFGNGGSAADAQHIAGELVGRFLRERQALAAMALTTDTSIMTAIGNDYSFERVFARQIEALGQPGDVALAISTSGRSRNIVAALETARARGMATVAFTGEDGGELPGRVDYCFRVPSTSTPRIQEAHIAAGHAICELVELALGVFHDGGTALPAISHENGYYRNGNGNGHHRNGNGHNGNGNGNGHAGNGKSNGHAGNGNGHD